MFLSCITYPLRAQEPHVASDCYTGQHRYRTFPLPQEVLWDDEVLDQPFNCEGKKTGAGSSLVSAMKLVSGRIEILTYSANSPLII